MLLKFFTERRRARLKAVPFLPEWRRLLEVEMPFYRGLTADERLELENHAKVLLAEKKFVGAQGLEVTDEMRVLIAAQAAVLLMHRQATYFPKASTIVIYPSAFVSDVPEEAGGGVYLQKPQARIGESNAQTGVVVLAWDSVLSGSMDPRDGRNVVLHEFAHQLDSEYGSTANGAPVLGSRSAYRAWAEIMSDEFAHMHADMEHHRRTFIDEYGATNPAEFFAVVTEAFFEKPLGLKKHNPQLYAALVGFYKQDPAVVVARI